MVSLWTSIQMTRFATATTVSRLFYDPLIKSLPPERSNFSSRTTMDISGCKVDSLDHLVLTVKDMEKSIQFYSNILGMSLIQFGEGRKALQFGNQKINLHQAGREFKPHAKSPTPGSADLCFVTTSPLNTWISKLAGLGVTIEEGPVKRTGAIGPITSVYIRDPDENLIEIAYYGKLD